MPEPLVVEDVTELRALHGALFEAKYRLDPINPVVPLSPFVAELSRRVVDALAAATGEDWSEWKRAENHRHRFPIIVEHIAGMDGWPALEAASKRETVRMLLAPLDGEDATVSELVESGDNAHRAV